MAILQRQGGNMNTMEIREDLKQIKFYYSRKKLFVKGVAKIGQIGIQSKLDKYNSVICLATPQMYELYYEIDVTNKTHEEYADEYGYSVNYVYKLNHKLMQYFEKELSAA